MLTTLCAVSFLLSVKCVLLCEKNAWFTEEIFNWLGGCVKHVKHGFEGGADRYCILSSHKAMTVTMTVDTGTPPVYDGPPSSLFLKLCGMSSRTLDLRRTSLSRNWGVRSVLDSTLFQRTCSLSGLQSLPCLSK